MGPGETENWEMIMKMGELGTMAYREEAARQAAKNAARANHKA